MSKGRAIRQYDKIKDLLTRKKHLRSNLKALESNLFFAEIIAKGIDPKELSAYDFLQMYATSEFVTYSSTVRRTWQMVQEQCPELRGSHRKTKKLEQEAVAEVRSHNSKLFNYRKPYKDA